MASANYGDGNYGAGTYGDITPPTLAEVTPVPTPATDTTPNYTFSSSEIGTIAYGGSCSSATTSATAGNNTITFNTLALGTYTNCTITVTDASDNESDTLTVTAFTISASDTTAPTLAQVTPVSTPTTDTTPNYTFSSNEPGTIQYGGSCSSATTSATAGNNTITFNTLALGTYTNCTIRVTDSSSNQSSPLSVSSFTIVAADTTAPTLGEVTPVTTPTTDTTPSYTFSSNEAGTIQYGGSCSSGTTSASIGNNTVTFNALSAGTYTNCTIRVTDSSSNQSSPLSVSSFTIVDDGIGDGGDEEEDEEEEAIDFSRPKLAWLDKIFKLYHNAFPRLNSEEFTIKGTDEDLAGGRINFTLGGRKVGHADIEDNGDWKKKIHSTKSGELELKLEYEWGDDSEDTRTYKIFIDAEKPVFATAPASLTKRPGESIWWSATDNDRIDYYRYELNGRIYKTEKTDFLFPKDLGPGLYGLVIKAYDRAGNTATLPFSIRVPGSGGTSQGDSSTPAPVAETPAETTPEAPVAPAPLVPTAPTPSTPSQNTPIQSDDEISDTPLQQETENAGWLFSLPIMAALVGGAALLIGGFFYWLRFLRKRPF
ncbi:MAG: hypothetical protein WDN67_03070 [Candidatus Moraniibacteriota bacterium]